MRNVSEPSNVASSMQKSDEHIFEEYAPNVNIQDYEYHLPHERIAVHPLEKRDHSKLLVADVKADSIQHKNFYEIPDILSSSSLVVMNNTKVVYARLAMQKSTGGKAEVLCLAPIQPSVDPALTLSSISPVQWSCMVGGRNIHEGAVLSMEFQWNNLAYILEAHILQRTGTSALVEFKWNKKLIEEKESTNNSLDMSEALPIFGEILEHYGNVPLPPYIKRETEEVDKQRYQTVYANKEGSVAAPTAGLHFTPALLEQLHNNGIETTELTLHVGAGTFQPVQDAQILNHVMHTERIAVTRNTVLQILEKKNKGCRIVAVGTTTVRTLESLYWFGVKIARAKQTAVDALQSVSELLISQWEAYQLTQEIEALPTVEHSMEAILEWMEYHHTDTVQGETQMCIAPGYSMKVCNDIITNFHQPESTLILLVSAVLGKKLFEDVYQSALSNNYRFLSYGDSSLLRM